MDVDDDSGEEEEGVGFEMLATPPKMAMAAAAAYPQVRHSIRPCCHLCLWHESHAIFSQLGSSGSVVLPAASEVQGAQQQMHSQRLPVVMSPVVVTARRSLPWMHLKQRQDSMDPVYDHQSRSLL